MVDGIEGSWQMEQYQSTKITLVFLMVNHADHVIVYVNKSRLHRMKWAVRWLANGEQTVSLDMFRESAIDHFLNNLRQKAEAGDGSVWCWIIKVHRALL